MPVGQSTKGNSSRKAKTKPEKPEPDFPLFAHANGQWAKKIKQKLYFFGVWADPDAALEKYLDEKDDLRAGRKPRSRRNGITLRELVNEFLTTKKQMVDSDELRPKTFYGYHQHCEHLIKFWGGERLVEDFRADDFNELRADTAKRQNPTSVGNMVRLTKILFKYAYDAELIESPIRFGTQFKAPAKKNLRRTKQSNGKRMFEAEQLRIILDALDGQEITLDEIDAETGQPVTVKIPPRPDLRAMVLLGINCGLGNTDCSELTPEPIDLEGGWLDYPRVKTWIDRRCPLWPETVSALEPLLEGKSDSDNVFLTSWGKEWVRVVQKTPKKKGEITGGYTQDNIGKEFSKVLKKLKLNRKGLNFYALRHGFETIGGESKDQPAVDHIMGHVDPSMAAEYRESISDERLLAVSNRVRNWLFPDDSPND